MGRDGQPAGDCGAAARNAAALQHDAALKADQQPALLRRTRTILSIACFLP